MASSRSNMDEEASRDFQKELHEPRLVALLFADYATSTSDSKAVVGGIFERLFLIPRQPGHPAHAYQFFVFLKVTEAFSSDILVKCYAPSGEVLQEFGFRVEDKVE